MIKRFHWHRFRPHQRKVVVADSSDDHYVRAQQYVFRQLPRHPRIHHVNNLIDRLRREALAAHHDETYKWLAALMVQAPRAAEAQIQMDKHHHGYHNKQERLYELIDFNDTFVAVVLALSPLERTVFAERAKQLCDDMCLKTHVTTFTDEQWQAITKGLSREIAVYLAAENTGFDAHMTTRTQDALGIDMQVRDPETRRYINIDCKTTAAFRHRLDDLVREGRIAPREQIEADERGYIVVANGHGEERAEIVLLDIRPDLYGKIVDFVFVDTSPIRERLAYIVQAHGIDDGKFGITTIATVNDA